MASFHSAPVATPQVPDKSQVLRHPVYGTTFLSQASKGVKGLADGAEALQDERYAKRIIALLNTTGNLIQSWSADERSQMPVATLTITAKGMVANTTNAACGTVARKRQSSLKDLFSKPQKRLSSSMSPIASACIDISDTE